MPLPDLDSFICEAWGWPDEYFGAISAFVGAANLTTGTNPAYSIATFQAMYPKFLGSPVAQTMSVTTGSPNATLPAANTSLAQGQLITGADIPAGTTIQSINGTAVVLSANATGTNASEAAQVYTNALIPVAVLNVFIALAQASVMQARWQDAWSLGMALFIAHYATLWLRSDGDPQTTAGQAVSAGLNRGIVTSKAVGDTSVSYQLTGETADWGTWNLTTYGQQFASMARVIGAGPMLIW